MLREERLKHIIDLLNREQRVFSTALMEEFKVSEGTIRRDLNELEAQGLLKKVHGGAVPRPEAPRPYDGRIEFASQRKAALAQKALPMLKDGQLLIIDGGTTNFHLAQLIPQHLHLTVFTNSIPVAHALMHHPILHLHLLGGPVFKASQVTTGTDMITVLDNLRADICFIGIRSIHHNLGVSTLEYQEARIKHLMVQASEQTVVMATQDKIDTVDHFKICDLDEIDVMIVEDVEDELIQKYREKDLEIF